MRCKCNEKRWLGKSGPSYRKRDRKGGGGGGGGGVKFFFIYLFFKDAFDILRTHKTLTVSKYVL